MTNIDGLTIEQAKAVEGATKLAPTSWHDGIVNAIAAKLNGPPPWPNATVQAAIIAAVNDTGVDSPFLT
jgi:hypothetical protein